MNQRNIIFVSFVLEVSLHHPSVHAESNFDYFVNFIVRRQSRSGYLIKTRRSMPEAPD